MKRSMIAGWLACMLAIAYPTLAQKNDDQVKRIARRFDSTLLRLSRIRIADPKEVQKVVSMPQNGPDIMGPGLTTLQSHIASASGEIAQRRSAWLPARSSVPGSSEQIDKDMLTLLAGLPEPIGSLPQAAAAIKPGSDENIYTHYIEKVKGYREGLSARIQHYIEANQKSPALLTNEARQQNQQTMDMLASNPVIKQMGGLEAIKNMTPQQREAMTKQIAANAQQTAAKAKQDPSAYIPQQPVTQTSHDAAVANRSRAEASIAIEKRYMAIMDHAKEMAAVIGRIRQETNTYFESVSKKISDEYGARIAALPVVDMGEAGKGKNTYPVDIAYNILVYAAENERAVAEKEIWKRSLEGMKLTIDEYNALLSDYGGDNKSTASILAEKGMTPLQLSARACEDLIRHAQEAKSLTSQNASWQRHYNEKVLHIYE